MPRRGWLVLVLLAAPLSGCLGGLGEPGGTTATDAEPTLPPDVTLDAGTVVSENATSITFLWEDTLGASVLSPGSLSESTAYRETALHAPGGTVLQVTATLVWETGGDLTVQLMTSGGGRACADYGGGVQAFSAPDLDGSDRVRTCAALLQADQDDGLLGAVRVSADHNLQDTPFTVELTATAVDVERVLPLGEMLAFETAADDGTLLRGHVYVPDGDGPFPTILNYNPYDNVVGLGSTDGKASGEGDAATLVPPYGRFLQAGYAMAFVNIRGTGISDGCNVWFNAHVDGPDAANVIEALAAADWSDGTVGMIGISWHGYSQYAALYEQPEALKAVAPASAILDFWTLMTRRGPTITTQFGPMASTYAVFHALTTTGPGDQPRHVDCPSAADHMAEQNQLTVSGDKTPYVQERDNTEVLARNEVPMLVSNGLTKFGEGHILQIDGLWPLMNERSRLLIGQWGHAYPPATPSGEDYWDVVLAWMDHHVRGVGPEPPMGVADYQDLGGAWHRAGSWPPPANTTRLHLSDGALVSDPDAVVSSLTTFQTTGADPSVDACPGTKAVYVSPPVAEDVLLAGNFHTNLTLTSTSTNSNLGVFLWTVDALPACGGAAPVAEPLDYSHEVSRALSDLAHRGHLETGEPFPVGQPDGVAMQSHPFATPVSAGQRLVLAVTGGALELSMDHVRSQLSVHTGSDVETWIDIPVVEGELVFANTEDAANAALPSSLAGTWVGGMS